MLLHAQANPTQKCQSLRARSVSQSLQTPQYLAVQHHTGLAFSDDSNSGEEPRRTEQAHDHGIHESPQ